MANVVQGISGMLRGASLSSAAQEQEYTVAVSLLAAYTAITIPNGMTYQGADLQVFWNGQRKFVGKDFNYVGTGAKTQVSMNFDMYLNESLIFRKEL